MMQSVDIQEFVKVLEQCVSLECELQRLYAEPSLSVNDDLEQNKILHEQLMEFVGCSCYSENMTPGEVKIKHVKV